MRSTPDTRCSTRCVPLLCTLLLATAGSVAFAMDNDTPELKVTVSQAVLGNYTLEDGRNQVEIEFTITNDESSPLYDVRVIPTGSTSVPIDLPEDAIRINELDPGDTGSVTWTFDLHSDLGGGDIRIFGRVEAVDTSTGEIRGRDIHGTWGAEQ